MRGTVNIDLNERRHRPSVNATISGTYKKGDIVEIEDAVLGDMYDGDDLWYKLKNGAFVWNGAVDVDVDCGRLSERDREHYLISYRNARPDGKPDMFDQDPASSLFFMPVRLPVTEENIRLNHLLPGPFADGVMQSIGKLTNKGQRHVFVYIHGFQPFSSLKLDLFSSFVQNYLTHPKNKIAKVLFMVWPAQGLSRKRADDRAIQAGKDFTSNKLWAGFEELSIRLRKEGKFLNLLAHSFGNQLLNGMVNPDNPLDINNIPEHIFENVFLMAPDVTHLTVRKMADPNDPAKFINGARLRNFFGREDTFNYDYSGLTRLAKNVHVFHDQFDYLLYASTKKFVGSRNIRRVDDRLALTKDYRNLGNYGESQILLPELLQAGFTFSNVQDLVSKTSPGNLCDFPFQKMKSGSAFEEEIKKVISDADYEGFGLLEILFNRRSFENYHKYVYTCKPVVDEVLRLL